MTDKASAIDPVLSWGSSVNVSEDLRRSIRAECDQLDAQIGTVTTQTTNESRKTQSLNKDLNFSVQEMRNLVRDGTEEMDGCIMNSTVRGRMAEQLEVELGSLLRVSDDEAAPQDQVAPKLSSGSESPTTTALALSAYLADGKAKFQEMKEQIRDNADDIRNTQQLIIDIDREAKNYLERIASDNLNVERKSLEKEVNSKKRELEGEKTKIKSVLDQVQRARKNCGDQAQQIAELVSFYYTFCLFIIPLLTLKINIDKHCCRSKEKE